MGVITSGSVSSRRNSNKQVVPLTTVAEQQQQQHVPYPVHQERKNSKYDPKYRNNNEQRGEMFLDTMKKNCHRIMMAFGVVLTLLVLLQSSSSLKSGGDNNNSVKSDGTTNDGRKLSEKQQHTLETSHSRRKLKANVNVDPHHHQGATTPPTEAPTIFEGHLVGNKDAAADDDEDVA